MCPSLSKSKTMGMLIIIIKMIEITISFCSCLFFIFFKLKKQHEDYLHAVKVLNFYEFISVNELHQLH